MSGREGGKKKPLKAPKKDGKVRRINFNIFYCSMIISRKFKTTKANGLSFSCKKIKSYHKKLYLSLKLDAKI